MDSFTVSTQAAAGTRAVAALLAPFLRPGDVVLLVGDLATGKTTFVQAVASALGSKSPVTSPTFTLAHFYPAEPGMILHVDAYRLSGIHEYRDLGLDDYLEDSVTFVEWGDKVAEDFICSLTIEFHCEPIAPDLRVLMFSSECERWEPVISALRAGLLDAAKAE
jgi:tRNA threonylcarbamoyladenosine biosynthesis protein TsaE